MQIGVLCRGELTYNEDIYWCCLVTYRNNIERELVMAGAFMVQNSLSLSRCGVPERHGAFEDANEKLMRSKPHHIYTIKPYVYKRTIRLAGVLAL